MLRNLNLMGVLLLSFSGIAFAGTVAVVPVESTVVQVIPTPAAAAVITAAPAAVTIVTQVATIPTASLATSFTSANLQQIQAVTQNLLAGAGAANIPAGLQAQLQTLLQNVQTAMDSQSLLAGTTPDQP